MEVKSTVRHIANKHEDHPDDLFPKCAHDSDLEDRGWIKMGKIVTGYVNIHKVEIKCFQSVKASLHGMICHKQIILCRLVLINTINFNTN